MPLSEPPEVHRLTLATVTSVPEWHPEHDTFEPFPVHAWVIRHPDGPILVDTGVGLNNRAIDEWYHPQITLLASSLDTIGLTPTDIVAVVLSHLHFDHCGQQGILSAPTTYRRSSSRRRKYPATPCRTGRQSRGIGFDSSMEM